MEAVAIRIRAPPTMSRRSLCLSRSGAALRELGHVVRYAVASEVVSVPEHWESLPHSTRYPQSESPAKTEIFRSRLSRQPTHCCSIISPPHVKFLYPVDEEKVVIADLTDVGSRRQKLAILRIPISTTMPTLMPLAESSTCEVSQNGTYPYKQHK